MMKNYPASFFVYFYNKEADIMGLCYQESLEHFLTVFKKSGEMSEYASEFIPGSYSRRSFNYGPHAIYVDRA